MEINSSVQLDRVCSLSLACIHTNPIVHYTNLANKILLKEIERKMFEINLFHYFGYYIDYNNACGK